jgi:prefoldin subunit 2
MVNGVLVERSVGDVLPALQTNSDGLKKVLEDLLKQYQTKQTEMEKWKVSSMCEITFALWMLMQYTEEE